MYQQINLYQPVLRNQAKVFGTHTLLLVAGAVLTLLLGIVVHAHWTLAAMNETEQILQQQVAGLNDQLSALEAKRRTPNTAELDSTIARLRGDIEQHTALLTQFDQLATRQESGFAAWFETLATEHLPGLWLEGVSIDSDKHIELRGLTLDAKLVPLYLQQLEQRRGRREKPFETVSITRNDSAAPQLQFVLRNFKGEPAWRQP